MTAYRELGWGVHAGGQQSSAWRRPGRAQRDIRDIGAGSSDGTARNVVFTDTMSGPIEIVGVRLYHEAGACTAAIRVTCQFPTIGVAGSFGEEVWVTVRVTAPGAFSHTAHATAFNSTPNSGADTAREENIGIALAAFTLSASSVAGGTAVSREGDADVPGAIRRGGRQDRQQQSHGRAGALAADRSAADRDPVVQHRPRRRLAADERHHLRDLRARHDSRDLTVLPPALSEPGPDTQHDDWVVPDGRSESHADGLGRHPAERSSRLRQPRPA